MQQPTLLESQGCRGEEARAAGEDGAPARLVNGVDGFIGDPTAYDTLPVQHLNGYRYLACPPAVAALYVGGILVRHAACVTIAVTGPDGKSATVSVPVLRSCPRHAR